jgi:hypothetical protein
MKFSLAILAGVFACAAFAPISRAQLAQTSSSTTAQTSHAAAVASSLPDWAGIWTLDFPKRGDPPAEVPSLTPPAAAELKVLQEEEAKNEEPPTESANCLPPGMPTIMFQPYDVEFLFTPGRVTIIQEAYMQVRRVFTDGRGHPADSIGHWEGDTLVIDTVGLGHKTPLGYNRLNHGPHLHTIERIHLLDPDKMVDEMTLIDPDVLAKPWHTVHTFTRHRDLDQLEFICEENNRNPLKNGEVSTIIRK